MTSLLIRSGTLVEAAGSHTADVLIGQGKIESVGPAGSLSNAHGQERINADGLLILPLLIDCHVHFREPGYEEKATMETEAASALIGGVGAVCEMPNTVPPTVTIAAFADKVRRSEKIAGVKMFFFFGVTQAAHLVTLRELWTGESYELKRLRKHCCGVKLYLDHSTGDQKVESGIVEEIFRTCAELKIPLVAHCEDADINAHAQHLFVETSRRGVSTIADHSKMRPPESEAKAIEYAIGLVKKYNTPFHVAHLSTAQGIGLVRAAKKDGLPVTCEVSPHHLFLTTDDYVGLGTFAKMNPPLRSPEHQRALWEGIADGTVDCIATDHAPHTREEKTSGEPLQAPSGVPGVATMLPLMLSVAAGKWPHPTSPSPLSGLSFGYSDLVRLSFTRPNQIFSLHQESIAKLAPARLLLIDPAASSVLHAGMLQSKCAWTPFEGWNVTGGIVRLFA